MSNQNSSGKIGLRASVNFLIGGMIGSAIYSISGLTIYFAGPATIITWIVAAIVLYMYGVQVTELAVRFPKSGGVFVFPSKSLGKSEKQGQIWGWFSFWGFFASNVVAIAFSAIYVGTYLSAGFPIFANMQVPLALIACLIVFVLAALDISASGKVNNILVGGLILTLLTYVIVAFTSGHWNASNLTPFFTQGALGSTGWISAIPNAMVAYGSCVSIAFMVSEVKNPNKIVPKSILYAMIAVVGLYLLSIIATLGLITAQFLIDNAGMRFIPFYAASFTQLTAFPWLPKIISISAVLALITTMLVVTMMSSRAISAVAESGLLPKALGDINPKTGTPIKATVLITVLSMIVSCFPQFTQEIVNLGSLFAAITIVVNCFSLIVARKKFGYEGLEYRAIGGNALPWITIIIIVASYVPGIIQGGWLLWAYTIGMYLIGFLIMMYFNKKNKVFESEGKVFK